MEMPKLSRAPLSLKLLNTVILLIIGLTYLTLVVHIYIDTEMKVSLIKQAYGFMDYIELTTITHDYLPYYSLFIFFIPAMMLMFSNYSEKLKCFFAVWPFLVIAADLISMWLIPYVSEFFAWTLFIAGSLLGMTFLAMFVLILFDMWIRKPAANA